MSDCARYRVNTPNVTHETIDGEVVIVDLGSGAYFSMDGVGAAIWNLLAAGFAADEVVDRLADRTQASPEEFEEAVHELTRDLTAERLIVEDAGAALADDVDVGVALDPSASFVPPVLQRFSDMQDLLLLDPIHEVDPTGWPHAKATPDEG